MNWLRGYICFVRHYRAVFDRQGLPADRGEHEASGRGHAVSAAGSSADLSGEQE